jgi:hypothetical protein
MSQQESKFNNKIFTNIKKKIYNENDYLSDESTEVDENIVYIFKNLNFVKWEIKINNEINKILIINHGNNLKNIFLNNQNESEKNQNESENLSNVIIKGGGGKEIIFEKSFSYNLNEFYIDITIEHTVKEMLRNIKNSQLSSYNEKNNIFKIIFDDIGSYYEGEGTIDEFLNS